jgi:hypothetical protein
MEKITYVKTFMLLLNKYEEQHNPTPPTRYQDQNYSGQRYVINAVNTDNGIAHVMVVVELK